MKEQLISFETAKLAKEKGFNIPIQHTVNDLNQLYDIDNNEITIVTNVIDDWNKFDTVCSAPTQSLLQKWLREKHKLRIFVQQGASGNFIFNLYSYPIPNNVGKWERFNNIQSYNSYEEALEKGLQEGLKMI